jgi:hypothetical protein
MVHEQSLQMFNNAEISDLCRPCHLVSQFKAWSLSLFFARDIMVTIFNRMVT